MDMLWNERLLSPPPTVTFAAVNDVENNAFLTHLSAALGPFKDTNALSSEYTVLDRLLYKFNNQLRKEKVIQTMKMVRQAMKRVAEMNMRAEIEKLHDTAQKTGSELYLPSRQMLQYLLVRLMGYAKLLIRASHCCQEAYIHCMQKLGRGDLVTQMLLFSSVTSRIWVLARALALHAINLYKDLSGYVVILEGTPVDWLPPNEHLPTDIHDWLGIGKDLSEPKVHKRVYNLGLGDKSKVDLDDILSKFSQEPSSAWSRTKSDTAVTTDIKMEESSDEGEPSLVQQPAESLKEGNSDEDQIASMDLDDVIDKFYGPKEDIGVSVKIERKELIQSTSQPVASDSSVDSKSTIQQSSADVLTRPAKRFKEDQSDLTSGKKHSEHQCYKQSRRDNKELARVMVWEQGVTEGNDSMDKFLQKMIRIEHEHFSKFKAKQLVRQQGVTEVDESMDEGLQALVKIDLEKKKQRSESKKKRKETRKREQSQKDKTIDVHKTPIKAEGSELSKKEQKCIAQELKMKRRKAEKRKKRRGRQKQKD